MSTSNNIGLNLDCHHEFSWKMNPYKPDGMQISDELSIYPCRCTWHLLIKDIDSSYFVIGLRRSGENIHVVNITLCIKRNSLYNNTATLTDSIILSSNKSEVFCRALLRSEVLNMRNNVKKLEGSITLSCNCILSLEQVKKIRLKEETIIQMQSDFSEAFEHQNLTDVVLKVGNIDFPAHKIVLSARSPVFRKMFESNMREEETGFVEVIDVEENIMQAFLMFLYSGTLKDENYETMFELYRTADKYDVKSLFNTCRCYFETRISGDNVLSILILAEMYNDEKLIEASIEFICGNFGLIASKDEWNNIINDRPRLASNILQKVSKKFSQLEQNNPSILL